MGRAQRMGAWSDLGAGLAAWLHPLLVETLGTAGHGGGAKKRGRGLTSEVRCAAWLRPLLVETLGLLQGMGVWLRGVAKVQWVWSNLGGGAGSSAPPLLVETLRFLNARGRG